MIASYLITLREGIEAALIVGIILAYLKKVGAERLSRTVYFGTWAGILASVGVGSLFMFLAVEFEGKGEQIFEGATMFLAAVILTTMILWMRNNSRAYSEGLKQKVSEAITDKATFALALLVFVSILREGIEVVLFLGSASFTASGMETLVGGTLGLLTALALGLAILRYSVRLDLKTFFNVTGVFLVLFAAGLIAHGLGEFSEAGIVPTLVDKVWDTSGIVSDGSQLGEVLGALFGYTGTPSLAQVLGYVGYLLVVVFSVFRDGTVAAMRKVYAVVRPA